MDGVTGNGADAARRDLVVVGGGMAGMTTALRAAELGLAVAVLEQGADERYPCNTRYSGGILHAAYHDVNRPADELAAIVAKSAGAAADPALVRAIATDGRRLLAWLRGHDVRFMRMGLAEQFRWGMAPPRPIMPGLEWRGRGPDAMLRTLGAALAARGGMLLRGRRARELVREGDRVVGVVAERTTGDAASGAGTRETHRAAAVVLADGGFQANGERFRAHIGPAFERVLQRGAANGRGDGLAMAESAGAAVRNLDAFYGHLQSRDALGDPRVWPYPDLDGVGASSIVVGPDGRRLIDEGLGGIGMANALARLPDPACATVVCDSAIWDRVGRSARFPVNPYLERYGGTVHRDATIAGLAARAGLPADALAATVAAYNAAVEGNALGTLAPRRSAGKLPARAIAVAPFLAIPVCVGITYTMGGIVVDGDGAALDPRGQRVPGLYAAGTTTTGLEGLVEGGQVGYVGGLIKAVLGLRAAEDVARALGRGTAPHAAQAAD